MIPITKNKAPLIRVIDVNGNVHEPTYPKRAKGLIKKGRARFVDDDTVCLLDSSCDKDDLSGDIMMSDINIDNANKLAMPDMSYIMSRMDKIIDSDEHIRNAIRAIAEMDPSEAPDGGEGDAGRANAIQSAVLSRETTNQRVLEMLNKMYDDIKPKKPVCNAEMLETILDSCHGGPFSDQTAMLLDKVQNLMERMGMNMSDLTADTTATDE